MHWSIHTASTLTFILAYSLPSAAQSQPNTSTLPQKIESFKAWSIVCPDGEGSNCQLRQELIQTNTGKLVSAVVIDKTKDGLATATFITPFGLLLPAGLRFSVDNGASLKAMFSTCLPQGCLASATLSPATLYSFKAGNRLDLDAEAIKPHQPVKIEFSLLGFSAAWKKLAGINKSRQQRAAQ